MITTPKWDPAAAALVLTSPKLHLNHVFTSGLPLISGWRKWKNEYCVCYDSLIGRWARNVNAGDSEYERSLHGWRFWCFMKLICMLRFLKNTDSTEHSRISPWDEITFSDLTSALVGFEICWPLRYNQYRSQKKKSSIIWILAHLSCLYLPSQDECYNTCDTYSNNIILTLSRLTYWNTGYFLAHSSAHTSLSTKWYNTQTTPHCIFSSRHL